MITLKTKKNLGVCNNMRYTVWTLFSIILPTPLLAQGILTSFFLEREQMCETLLSCQCNYYPNVTYVEMLMWLLHFPISISSSIWYPSDLITTILRIWIVPLFLEFTESFTVCIYFFDIDRLVCMYIFLYS